MGFSLSDLGFGSRLSPLVSTGIVNGSRSHRVSRDVVCMAHPRRVKMVAQQVKREISQMLLYDKVLQQAVLPERGLGADMYLTSVATISDVEMSNDLTVAKVYISVYGDDHGKELALEGLKSKAKYVRMGLGKRMSLKFTPEVRFIKDDALERGSKVLALLEKNKQERLQKHAVDDVSREENENDIWEGAEEILDEEEDDDVWEDAEEDNSLGREGVRNLGSTSAGSGKDVAIRDFEDEDENIIYIA